MLKNISYRLKVPLVISLVILVTGIVLSVALVWSGYGDMRQELHKKSTELGSALSHPLIETLSHDDLWSAYKILDSVKSSYDSDSNLVLVVLNQNHRVFVSNLPRKYPSGDELSKLNPDLAQAAQVIQRSKSYWSYPFEDLKNNNIYTILPLVSDNIALGSLVIGYSHIKFLPRFYAIVKRVALSSLLVLLLLLPIGWLLGNRLVRRLSQLADNMAQVGQKPAEEIDDLDYSGNDEIGRLGTSFSNMLSEIEAKQRLEHRMISADRLAAIGRLTAGIAHEINNPLGGMLNALNTFRRHGHKDPLTEKTLSLLERGLVQIQDTVSALLVEAKSESHELEPRDIDDVFRLLQPHARKREVMLECSNRLCDKLSLPSTQIRQVLLNLSLNAVQASPEGGVVTCDIYEQENRLQIIVDNTGDSIPKEQINQLFEPFAYKNPTGNGLGLWMTYQIVQQLNGEISVNSETGSTRFSVDLPLMLAA